MARRKKPDPENAASALDELIKTPREKPKTPLEAFVGKNFDKLIEAANTDYSLSEICTLLAKFSISATPKALKQAMCDFAVKYDRVSELPEKLIPKERQDKNTSKPKPESEFEKVIDQNSALEGNGDSSKKPRFNTRELKFDEV